MISDVITKFLESLDEYELEGVILSLLPRIGWIPLEKKIFHGPGELGRDLVAVSADGSRNVLYIVLKTGDLGFYEISKNIHEIMGVVSTEFKHPSIPAGSTVKPIIIHTGNITRDAETILGSTYDKFHRNGTESFEVWGIHKLTNDLINNIEYINPTYKEWSQVYSIILNNLSDLEATEWSFNIFKGLFNETEVKNNKDKFLLFVEVLSQHIAIKADDPVCAFQILKILECFAVHLISIVQKHGFDKACLQTFKVLENSYIKSIELISCSIEKLINKNNGLKIIEDGLFCIYVYPQRLHFYCWCISLLCHPYSSLSQEQRLIWSSNLIELIRNNEEAFFKIWWEKWNPSLALSILICDAYGNKEYAAHLAKKSLEFVMERFSKNDGIPRASFDEKDVIDHTFFEIFDCAEYKKVYSSLTASFLVDYLVLNNEHDILNEIRNTYPEVPILWCNFLDWENFSSNEPGVKDLEKYYLKELTKSSLENLAKKHFSTGFDPWLFGVDEFPIIPLMIIRHFGNRVCFEALYQRIQKLI